MICHKTIIAHVLQKEQELYIFSVEKDCINPNLEVLVGLTVPELS